MGKKTIPWYKPYLNSKEVEYVSDAVSSTWISDGKYINSFEEEFSKKINCKNLLTVSNGTTALQLAYLLLDIGTGDEVIVPGFGFIAPVNMAIAVGATPVYADIDKDTWCIDPFSIEKNITSKTKAIVAVHTYGNMCNMDEIMKIAKEHNLYVIEDTAEAIFSIYKNSYAGTIGDIGTFSFQSTKTITMGEGGAVFIQNDKLLQKAKQLRSHGMDLKKKYWHEIVAFNFRLTNMQAAIGCAQLESSDEIIKKKNKIYEIYKRELSKIEGITLQYIQSNIKPLIWAIAIKIDEQYFAKSRDEIMDILKEDGIETRPGFYDCATLPLYGAKNIPIAKNIASQIISLPSFTDLTENDIIYICKQLYNLGRKNNEL